MNGRSLLFLIPLLLLPTIGPTHSAHAQQKGTRWAVLIGVNDYAELQDLQFCSSDVTDLKNQLVASGFPKDQIFLIHDQAKERKYQPSRGNIERELELVLSLAGKNDLVLVAFSGHGMHLDGTSYLCPTESRVSRPQETMVSMENVYKQLNASKASLKLLVVDACRNDPRPRGQKSANPKEDNRKLNQTFERPPRGILVLTSCGAGQISYEDEKLQRGVFMNYVLEGLSGKADQNRNDNISLLELYEYATRQTKVFVARKFSGLQVPALRGEINGVFELARPGSLDEITNSIGMKLRLIPAGEFLMGSSRSADEIARQLDSKAEYYEDEYPQHQVRISQPFYLGTTEVTQGQWQAVMGTRPWAGKSYFKEGRDYPAVYISWEDAVDFCRKLSAKEGVTYRLPTEAEWEYACRAGSRTMYSFGDNLSQLGAYAWCDENAWDVDEKYAHIVGTKRANAWGLYDMHGNVPEWCQDWYDENYYGGSPTNDPEGPREGSYRVYRGGSFSNDASDTRSASRCGLPPDSRYFDFFGIRLARTP